MKHKKEIVCVIGVGYVGEHLVDIFSKKYHVVGYDISSRRVQELNEKYKMSSDDVMYSKCVTITCNEADIPVGACLYCISVPTLLKEDKSINDSYLKNAVSCVEKYVCDGSCVVMESSVSVGMTRNMLGFLRDKNVYVGFSPERVDPGREEPPSWKIPKIISGIDSESVTEIHELYSRVFEKVVPVSSLETAEMCKLYENCFRVINIAYANEIADACKKHGINPYEMVSASSTKPFGFMPFYSGLGIGGHCLPVNPYYLFVNNQLPLLNNAIESLNERPYKIANEWYERNAHEVKTVCVIGMAFKPGQILCVNSPGLQFAKTLRARGLVVYVYDPLVEMDNMDMKDGLVWIKEDEWSKEFVKGKVDVVIIAMEQLGVDWTVLENFDRRIIKISVNS
jgi:nucleotide sugar dehydrogenase